MAISREQGKVLLLVKDAIVEKCDSSHWHELGLLTGCDDLVKGHRRLLRSLSWSDQDYPGNALEVIGAMVDRDPNNLAIIEKYLSETFDYGGVNVSSGEPKAERIYFTPRVFTVPTLKPDPKLVSVMMPFDKKFNPVYQTIFQAVTNSGLNCLRVDKFWEDSAVIQDIFALIFRSYVVICDFTGRNSNVFYETGVAHTLGKHVIPIAQNLEDIPFDLQHHRHIRYRDDVEGRRVLQTELEKRINYFVQNRPA